MFTNNAVEKESYWFRIKTLQDNALIFHAIGPEASKDYTLIELQKSRIRLTANFGGELGRFFQLTRIHVVAKNIECDYQYLLK